MTIAPGHAEVRGGHDVDLPVNPFLALRVSFGMLLGENDFRVLMGNPRGKQMLHTAWLHGSGVVWGMGVTREGAELVVSPGLAVDGHGREVRLDARSCLPLPEWARDWQRRNGTPGSTIRAWVVAEFTGCLDRPVPALADPCDVTRKHDEYSRAIESASITIRPEPPARCPPYHRVRVLLGLDEAGAGQADREAAEAVGRVEAAEAHERPRELLRQFHLLAARDAIDWAPGVEDGQDGPGLFPVTEDQAGVVLAELAFEVTGCGDLGELTIDSGVRATLLPTSVLQDLACARAPALFGAGSARDAGGPRLKSGTVRWSRGNSRVSFWVTAPIADGSQESGIEVSSLSHEGRGWSPSHVDSVTLHDGGERVVVDLDDAPAYPTVRLVIRGTGPTPLFGCDPLAPFAGVEGGPPGTAADGHDAVETMHLSRDSQIWKGER